MRAITLCLLAGLFNTAIFLILYTLYRSNDSQIHLPDGFKSSKVGLDRGFVTTSVLSTIDNPTADQQNLNNPLTSSSQSKSLSKVKVETKKSIIKPDGTQTSSTHSIANSKLPPSILAESGIQVQKQPISTTGLILCPAELDVKYRQPVLAPDEVNWCRTAITEKDVVVGKSWGKLKSQAERDRFQRLNCNAVAGGQNPSCSDAWGDNHIYNWRKNVIVNATCSANKARITCRQNEIADHYCTMEHAVIDLTKQKRVSNGEVPKKVFEHSFLTVNCNGELDEAVSKIDFKLNHLFSSSDPGKGQCDVKIPGTTVLYSHDNIRNLCHTWNDVLNVWLQLWLEDIAAPHARNEQLTLLSIDSLKLYNDFGDELAPYLWPYRAVFDQILTGKAFAESGAKRVCFEKLITQPLPSRGFVWDHWQQDLPCSFVAPSSLYQRWNLQSRQGYSSLMPAETTNRALTVLLVLRSETRNDWGSYRTSRLVLNAAELTSALQTMAKQNGFTLLVKDMGRLSYKEQLILVKESSIIVGMHGAGLVHAMGMSIGDRKCCGVLEIFPKGEFTPVRGYANMIRKMGIHYGRIDISDKDSHGDGAIVPLTEVQKQLSVLLEAVEERASCVLPSVASNPYLH